jgi:phosphoserine phosphatase
MKGATETIKKLKKNNIKTAIVSAGLNVLAKRIGKNIGIDYIYSNGVKVDSDGFITTDGLIGVKLMYKDETIRNICEKHNISPENIASVGNSCFDIPMFEVTGFGIAFNPSDPCVKKYADVVVENKDLRDIYPYLERYIR